MKSLLSFILFFSATLSLAATQYEFKPESGKVSFKTKGWPNLINIKGEGKGVSGKLTEEAGTVSGDLSFDLTSLKTGIDLRDDHMKNKYLQVKQYPQAKLTLTKVKIPASGSGDIEFKGSLMLHNQSKEVSGKAQLKNKDGKISMSAEIPIKLTDFKIEIPSYQGITVAESVKINFETQVQKTN